MSVITIIAIWFIIIIIIIYYYYYYRYYCCCRVLHLYCRPVGLLKVIKCSS